MKRIRRCLVFAALILVVFHVVPTNAHKVEPDSGINTFDCALVTDVSVGECEALVAFYSSTNGAGWTDHTNWLETTVVDNWFGVTVLGGHVTKLILDSNLLSGPLPEEMSALSSLQTLDVSNNQVSGQIPLFLTNMTTLLDLQLFANQFSGTIPAELGNLSQLTSLDLGWNQLQGSIPPELGNLSNLTRLALYNNQLSGTIPAELGDLTNLQALIIGGNLLSGSIPPELGNLTQAYALYIEDCQLTGSIPATFGGLTSMMYLDLSQNQLSGSIPSQLGNLSNLRYLELYNNQLSGSLPASLGNLSQLSKMYLEKNQFSGSIPTQFGNLLNLTWLRLNSNQLTGTIPSQLGQGQLFQIYLQDNHLSGAIPAALGNLSDTLQILNLRNNELSGSLPTQLGNLVNLNYLDLSGNLLSGNVPASLTNLVELCEPGDPTFPCSAGYELNLGYNRLTVPATEPPASFLAIKDPDWFMTQWQREYIPNATGRIILSYSGRALITVPAGAASLDFYLEYKPLRAPGHPADGLAFGGLTFDLSAYDSLSNPISQFMLPLNMRISYNESDLIGVREETLGLFYWNSTSNDWEDAATTCPGGTTTRNLAENWISLPLCHLSEFALMGSKQVLQYLPILLR
ncbi:MAG TPA: hypothetical protein PLH64_07945 [Anaerolineaceae bacterium]|nr:hypothetical protein [Anaerolineaceae bacterium]